MRIFLCFTIFSILAGSAYAQSGGKTPFPNQPAMVEKDDSGRRILRGWSDADITIDGMTERQVPNHPAFAGAQLWLLKTAERDQKPATEKAFNMVGLKNAQLIAQTELNPDAIDVLDSHPQAHGHAVMLEGNISGGPTYGIALVLYGSTDDSPRSSSIHAFMAKKEQFEALGGFSIVAAKWLYASAAPNEDMRLEGSLAPQAATNRLALFFNKWTEAYVIPMMGLTMQMQMQSIQQMSSWNNAMNACGGSPSCTVTQDGTGNWNSTWD